MIRQFIMWMVGRCDLFRWHWITMWTANPRGWSGNYPLDTVSVRYMPLFPDEIQRGDNTIYRPLPWWAPFNILLHHWLAHDDEQMHDHPRWSVTIVLKGQITEKTPWGDRVLRPGAVVFRSPRYIHGFKVDRQHSARTWTLFIVGRRRKCQNTYIVQRRTEGAVR